MTLFKAELDWPFEPGDQADNQDAICPHCGHKHGDCWEWVEEMPKEAECEGCGKRFVVWAQYDITYRTEPLEVKT